MNMINALHLARYLKLSAKVNNFGITCIMKHYKHPKKIIGIGDRRLLSALYGIFGIVFIFLFMAWSV